MRRLLDWRLLTALLVFAFGMTVASCGEDDEVKPDTEQVTDETADGNQENTEDVENGETDGSEDNTEGDSGETDFENPDGGVAVDLALPSGTLWADRNIGAESPENYGDYFAWGETKPKSYYDWSTYKWCNGSYNTQTKYCTDSDYGLNGFTDNKTTLDPEDDAACANWGSDWCMPTNAQLQELRDNCTWTWTTQNGVNGYKVTGSNGNSIFFPAAGYRSTSLNYAGTNGFYWSRSLGTSYSYYACSLGFISSAVNSSMYYFRYFGQSVRPVIEVSE